MASTDTRSGFRLPWSSDRSHDDASQEPGVEATREPVPSESQSSDVAWPETDLHARLGIKGGEPRPPEPVSPDSPNDEEPSMVDQQSAPSSPAAPPRKPSKLMADLSAAIRSTAEAARDQALGQVDAEARQVVQTIREASTQGATELRQQSDEDIAGIRDWSKAEIARIREETDQKITNRKAALEDELADHAASVDHRVEDVEGEVTRYQADMDAYLESLRNEDDPARLATLAESMPDSPSFEAWLPREDDEEAGDEPAGEAQPVDDEAEATTIEPDAEAEAVEPDAGVVTDAQGEVVAETGTEFETEGTAVAEAVAVTDEVPEAVADEPPEAVADEPTNQPSPSGIAWGDTAGDWTTRKAADGAGDDQDVPRWATSETPEGFPTSDESGDPVDRGAIMAALEAAAEAVVAAESAADSADQAEAAADVAETAAELVRGRGHGDDDTLDPEAQAALDARVDAGGFETETFTGRLASLLPGHAGGPADGEPQTTQVIVAGLVSVASIASFKRHLGRVAGVTGVAVASGPDGEFVFNVTNTPNVAFRDVLPTMPGFAARVTSVGDGIVRVTARDPETEG
jgi:hypothetical protein